MTQSAADIYQAFLDRSSNAFFDWDFEGLAAMMVYPHVMETLDGNMRFDGPEKMVEAGRDFRDYLERMHTHDYFRLCSSAAFVTGRDDQIRGRHETYALRGGVYVVEPFRNEMCLELDDGVWKGAGIRAQVSNVNVPILSPKQLRARAEAAARELSEEQHQ